VYKWLTTQCSLTNMLFHSLLLFSEVITTVAPTTTPMRTTYETTAPKEVSIWGKIVYILVSCTHIHIKDMFSKFLLGFNTDRLRTDIPYIFD